MHGGGAAIERHATTWPFRGGGGGHMARQACPAVAYAMHVYKCHGVFGAGGRSRLLHNVKEKITNKQIQFVILCTHNVYVCKKIVYFTVLHVIVSPTYIVVISFILYDEIVIKVKT